MNMLSTNLRWLPRMALVLALLSFASVAAACPTCKDSLTENYIQAYGYSIMFMMSMPFLIFGSLAAYFYYEVRKARRQQDESRGRWSPEDEQQSRDRWSREAETTAATPSG